MAAPALRYCPKIACVDIAGVEKVREAVLESGGAITERIGKRGLANDALQQQDAGSAQVAGQR
jgi:hypothetical protein